ncbi:MAG: Glu-tRNA(Gln) amidotransferase GatDE subunit E, partial [Thermoanaerobaculia bacterium]|nr:Glu-tRNA(Gln) amidotransferase GatDE subunit E [Thermoanaerobaculia bacterium]
MLEPLDYEAVGFISGLEVHQQLLTRHKLFCRCPAGRYTERHDGEVLRHMRPTLSELGEYDGTALMEFKTKKEIVYLLNRLNVCTYEMDDTPPFLVKQEAIDGAIELCLMMEMDIIDEIHIARKQYLDGSIPTGFQRTAIVGVNGWLPFQGRRLTVTHVSVEEDSCREVRDKGHQIVWRTDRLGMPLTETVTGPELVTPEEVRDAILLCGLTARSTGRVRTGIGASRQDINVSVRGGDRVEIKGVPRAGYAVKLVHNEGVRQCNLLALRAELHRRGLRDRDAIRVEPNDVSAICAGIDLGFMRRALEAGGKVFAVKVPGVAGLAQHRTQPDTTFLDELSGRIRVIACLDEPPILLSGAALPEFPDRYRVLERLRKRLQLGSGDDFFVVCGPEED